MVAAQMFALSCNAFAETLRPGEIRTAQYREMQAKLCRGWNTWYNNSMSSQPGRLLWIVCAEFTMFLF